MEWVEVSGKTMEEAKEAALDQLGVAESDAEIIVLAEPKTGLFGRTRGEARIRARVQPAGPRPKRNRRPRERSRGGTGSSGGRRPEGRDRRPQGEGGSNGRGGQESGARSGGQRSGNGSGGRPRRSRGRSGGSDRAAASETNGGAAAAGEEGVMAEGMTLEEQAELAVGFVRGLVEQFGLEASVSSVVLDEETVEVKAEGEGLGILVGPRGSTLAAIQDLTRTRVQRSCPSRTDRILVDVAGYREKRATALRRFTEQVAGEVLESGEERALEPMSPADRKVVHDTVNDMDGVVTRSEGEDANRYVVIAPAGSD